MGKQGNRVQVWGSFLFLLVAVSIMVVISARSCQKKMTPVVQTVTAVAAEPEAREFLGEDNEGQTQKEGEEKKTEGIIGENNPDGSVSFVVPLKDMKFEGLK